MKTKIRHTLVWGGGLYCFVTGKKIGQDDRCRFTCQWDALVSQKGQRIVWWSRFIPWQRWRINEIYFIRREWYPSIFERLYSRIFRTWI